jgi:hypothetical protein
MGFMTQEYEGIFPSFAVELLKVYSVTSSGVVTNGVTFPGATLLNR